MGANMNGPGISLFQGSDSIQLNTSNQKEEEEFSEDEKIRKAELQDLIDNAFSDLDEDEIETDSSISSSHCSRGGRGEFNHFDHLRAANGRDYSSNISSSLGFSGSQPEPVKDSYNDNFIANQEVPFHGGVFNYDFGGSTQVSAHKNHCYHSNPPPIPEEDETEIQYKQTDLNGTNQMKVLYEVRLREIERLNKELEAEKEEKSQILRQLAVSEHDKKNLEISLNANKTLLAESRAKVSELENEISKLSTLVKEIERTKHEVRSELEITKTQLFHEQQKFAALERSDLNAKREKQMDLVIESLQSKHKSEVSVLQQDLDAAIERLEKKESDYNALEKKLDEMEQRHAAHLLTKCDSAMKQESTISALLEEANKEKQQLTVQINALQQECSSLKTELEQYNTFPSLRLGENSSSDDKSTDSFVLMSASWRPEAKKKSCNLNQTDLVNKLKEELHRSLLGQRTKRNEIMKLQEQVQAKELQVSKLKEQERLHLARIDSLKADMNKVLQQVENVRTAENKDTQLVAKLQSDIGELEKENSLKSQKIIALEKEIISLTEQLTQANLNNKSYSEEYLEFYEKELAKLKKDSEAHLQDKELEWGREMEKIVSECDEVKKLYLDMKGKKDEVSKKLVEVMKLYEEAKREKAELEALLDQKQKDIKTLEDHILRIGKEKIMSEENSLKDIEKELNNIVEKQTLEINMLKVKLQDVAKNDEELIRLQEEISNFKQRYIELENTLKSEFQESLLNLKEENSLLKGTLKKKEAELSLRKLCVLSQKRDVAIGTDDNHIIERLNEQNLAEIEKLEKEIDRLRNLDEAKTQEILKLSVAQEQLLNVQLQQLEIKLNTQHQQEILVAEKKMKDLSMKYFSEEMEKLRKQHAENLKMMRDEDCRKLNEYQQMLARKEEEMKALSAKKEQLEVALKRYEEERTRAGLIMTQWAKEVDQMRQEKEQLIQDMEQLRLSNLETCEACEKLKLKLKETKKAAIVYKRRLQEVKTSLSEKYKNLMVDLQEKVDDVVSAKELEIRDKLQQIENEYKNKERLLRMEDRNGVKSEIT